MVGNQKQLTTRLKNEYILVAVNVFHLDPDCDTQLAIHSEFGYTKPTILTIYYMLYDQ